MISQIDILKHQGDALSGYLKLQEGFCLRHSNCLEAVAAAHGHQGWNVVSALCRAAAADNKTNALSHEPINVQAGRLQRHLAARYGFKLSDPEEAVAAIRWGGIVEQVNQILGNAVAASEWLRQPHPQWAGSDPRELIETDAGYQKIERLLHPLT